MRRQSELLSRRLTRARAVTLRCGLHSAALGASCFRHSFVALACFLLLLRILHVNDMILDASAIGVALPAFGARASHDIAL